MMVREQNFTGGIAWFPYQLAFGVSVRWGQFAAVRLYLGPIKIWVGW